MYFIKTYVRADKNVGCFIYTVDATLNDRRTVKASVLWRL